jgi:enediyne biosynthesis protein E4
MPSPQRRSIDSSGAGRPWWLRQSLRLLPIRGIVAALLTFVQVTALAQELPAQTQTGRVGGNSTGGTFAPVYDSEHRPITAGGFVDTGPVVFQDITRQAGLANWRHVMGTPEKNFILEADGSGVGLIDYDNDGWLDIYLVNGSTFNALDGKESPPHAALFHNNHDGTFTDVAAAAGVTNDRWGFGIAIGDYDNDGWPDIFVTNYGKNRLYHNNHDGTFTDVAEKAGIALGGWSTGATFGDYDGDGRLDLFVAGYVHFNRDNPPIGGSNGVASSYCKFRGVTVMCGPRGLKGEHDHLFHNNGDGTFTDVSVKAGVSDPETYYGFTAIFADLNDDGKVDLVVANDSTPSYFYVNKGEGTFQDDSYSSGFALNQDGREIASMGIAIGDYQNSGRLSLFNTDFSDDYKVLYRNDGNASFTDASYAAGVAEVGIPFVGWGDGFLDYDNDGWLDLMQINGHVYPAVDKNPWGTSFAERPLLFHNLGGKKFEYVPAVRGTGLAVVTPGRGAAFGDLFNEGKIDVVINPIDGPPVLLRDVNDDKHHWVELKLVGGPKGPRDAVGTTVYLNRAGMRQRGDVLSGGSYISSNDQRVHFGLGDATTVDSVEILWSGGVKETVKLPTVDRIYTITQGKGITGELCVLCTSNAAGPARF